MLEGLVRLAVQVSSVPWPSGPSGGHARQFSGDPLPVFCVGGLCEQFWHMQECWLFLCVHLSFPLPAAASSTLQDALKDRFCDAVAVPDMPTPCKFLSGWHTLTNLVTVNFEENHHIHLRDINLWVEKDSNSNWTSCTVMSILALIANRHAKFKLDLLDTWCSQQLRCSALST